MEKEVYLSVVIPSYNEEANIKRGVLGAVYEYLKKQNYEWELILSDDGSSDSTISELEKFAQLDKRIQVLKNIHAGKAPTVTAGMMKASGAWRLFTDFDQSTPIADVEKLLSYAQKGCDVVIGSREIIGAMREKEPIHRHVMGRVFNIMVQFLAIPGILDTQCGFKLFSDKATKLLFSNLFVYGHQGARKDAFTGAFDVELLYLAKKAGYSVVEVPIVWKHNVSHRVSPIKDSLRMLRDIILIKWANLRGKYGRLYAT
jgi:dolichyl-phosphate beta-glucosyltransferase